MTLQIIMQLPKNLERWKNLMNCWRKRKARHAYYHGSVINHCSDKHEWFQKALADPEGEYADYFYFREGKNGNPPSNYRSYFGGSCWEPVPGTDKYYFHMFAKEQRI